MRHLEYPPRLCYALSLPSSATPLRDQQHTKLSSESLVKNLRAPNNPFKVFQAELAEQAFASQKSSQAPPSISSVDRLDLFQDSCTALP